MDTGLEEYWTIKEPWSDDSDDVGHYLCERRINYTLRSQSGYAIYSTKLSKEDLTALKLIFPGIKIMDNVPKEKVSTIARRVLNQYTK